MVITQKSHIIGSTVKFYRVLRCSRNAQKMANKTCFDETTLLTASDLNRA